VNTTWHRALKKIKLPNGKPFPDIRMHDLRHTKGTLMIDEGEDIVVVQRTLGHARSSITADHYVGRISKAVKRAGDRYGELLDPGGHDFA
jgi:integrase